MQVQVGTPAHQAVAEPGAVDEEGQAVPEADFPDPGQFLLGIDGPVFRREGDVDHAGKYHVGAGLVGIEAPEVRVQFFREDFPLMGGKGQYLVPCEFDGTGLVDPYVACFGRNDPFVAFQHCGNHRGVGLGAAREEEDLCVRAADGLPDPCLCAQAETVFPVSGFLDQVGFGETPEDFRDGSDVIIASERDHGPFVLYPCKDRKIRGID